MSQLAGQSLPLGEVEWLGVSLSWSITPPRGGGDLRIDMRLGGCLVRLFEVQTDTFRMFVCPTELLMSPVSQERFQFACTNCSYEVHFNIG